MFLYWLLLGMSALSRCLRDEFVFLEDDEHPNTNTPPSEPELKVPTKAPEVPAPGTLRQCIENEGAGQLYQELKILEDSMYGERRRMLQESAYRLERFMQHYGSNEHGSIEVQNLLICILAAKNCENGHNSHFEKHCVSKILEECYRMLQEKIRDAATSVESMIDALSASEVLMRILDDTAASRVEGRPSLCKAINQ